MATKAELEARIEEMAREIKLLKYELDKAKYETEMCETRWEYHVLEFNDLIDLIREYTGYELRADLGPEKEWNPVTRFWEYPAEWKIYISTRHIMNGVEAAEVENKHPGPVVDLSWRRPKEAYRYILENLPLYPLKKEGY